MAAVNGLKEILHETKQFKFSSILDIGLGTGEATEFFLKNNKKVEAIGFDIKNYGIKKELFDKIKIYKNENVENMKNIKSKSYDAIWFSHTLEHVRNTGLALNEINRVLKDDGILFLIVPEYRENVLGGHINIGWNIGTLMYNLVLSKFNVKNGAFTKHKKQIACFVRKDKIKIPNLRYDKGDIETLKNFFPNNMSKQGFQGNINSYNWKWKYYKETNTDKIEKILTHLKNLVDKILNGIYYLLN